MCVISFYYLYFQILKNLLHSSMQVFLTFPQSCFIPIYSLTMNSFALSRLSNQDNPTHPSNTDPGHPFQLIAKLLYVYR